MYGRDTLWVVEGDFNDGYGLGAATTEIEADMVYETLPQLALTANVWMVPGTYED